MTAVREVIEQAKIPVVQSEIALIPDNTVKVSGHAAAQVLKLVEELEDHDDIQGVAANFDIDEAELAQFSAA